MEQEAIDQQMTTFDAVSDCEHHDDSEAIIDVEDEEHENATSGCHNKKLANECMDSAKDVGCDDNIDAACRADDDDNNHADGVLASEKIRVISWDSESPRNEEHHHEDDDNMLIDHENCVTMTEIETKAEFLEVKPTERVTESMIPEAELGGAQSLASTTCASEADALSGHDRCQSSELCPSVDCSSQLCQSSDSLSCSAKNDLLSQVVGSVVERIINAAFLKLSEATCKNPPKESSSNSASRIILDDVPAIIVTVVDGDANELSEPPIESCEKSASEKSMQSRHAKYEEYASTFSTNILNEVSEMFTKKECETVLESNLVNAWSSEVCEESDELGGVVLTEVLTQQAVSGVQVALIEEQQLKINLGPDEKWDMLGNVAQIANDVMMDRDDVTAGHDDETMQSYNDSRAHVHDDETLQSYNDSRAHGRDESTIQGHNEKKVQTNDNITIQGYFYPKVQNQNDNTIQCNDEDTKQVCDDSNIHNHDAQGHDENTIQINDDSNLDTRDDSRLEDHCGILIQSSDGNIPEGHHTLQINNDKSILGHDDDTKLFDTMKMNLTKTKFDDHEHVAVVNQDNSAIQNRAHGKTENTLNDGQAGDFEKAYNHENLGPSDEITAGDDSVDKMIKETLMSLHEQSLAEAAEIQTIQEDCGDLQQMIRSWSQDLALATAADVKDLSSCFEREELCREVERLRRITHSALLETVVEQQPSPAQCAASILTGSQLVAAHLDTEKPVPEHPKGEKLEPEELDPVHQVPDELIPVHQVPEKQLPVHPVTEELGPVHQVTDELVPVYQEVEELIPVHQTPELLDPALLVPVHLEAEELDPALLVPVHLEAEELDPALLVPVHLEAELLDPALLVPVHLEAEELDPAYLVPVHLEAEELVLIEAMPADKHPSSFKLKRKKLMRSPVTRRREIRQLCENFAACEKSAILDEIIGPVTTLHSQPTLPLTETLQLSEQNPLACKDSPSRSSYPKMSSCYDRYGEAKYSTNIQAEDTMEFPWLSLTLFMLLCTGLLMAADIGGQPTGDSTIMAFIQDLGLDTEALEQWWDHSQEQLAQAWDGLKEWLLQLLAAIKDWFEEGKLQEVMESLQDHVAVAIETIKESRAWEWLGEESDRIWGALVDYWHNLIK